MAAGTTSDSDMETWSNIFSIEAWFRPNLEDNPMLTNTGFLFMHHWIGNDGINVNHPWESFPVHYAMGIRGGAAVAIVEDWWVEVLNDYETTDRWHYLSVTFVRYSRSIKTDVIFYIDNNAPVTKTILGTMIDLSRTVSNCPPFDPPCHRTDTIGFNFRGMIKYVRINTGYNVLP